MGEYGFDHDTGKTTYHYGDDFATDSDGRQYMEVGDGHVVDLESGDVHYSPSGSRSSYGEPSLWVYIGAGCLLLCLIYTFMIFNTDAKYFLHALVTGLFAYFSFFQAKQ